MNISLKDYIYSAFSNLLNSNEKKEINLSKNLPKDKLLIAKNKAKTSFRKKEDLKRIFDSDEAEHFFDFLIWPCNTFAICTSILKDNGDYRLLISGEGKINWTNHDAEEVIEKGKIWNDFLTKDLSEIQSIDLTPLNELLSEFFNYENSISKISHIKTDREKVKKLLKICLCADESFSGINTLDSFENTVSGYISTELTLSNTAHGYQLAFTDDSFSSVHYKATICQSGISINSISNNLALISPEIRLKYIEKIAPKHKEKTKDILNILILPWPLKIGRKDFSEVKNNSLLNMKTEFGFFSYSPRNTIKTENIKEILKKYHNDFENLDIIVLPECALKSEKADEIFHDIVGYCRSIEISPPTLITGTFKEGNKNEYGVNSLKIFLTNEEAMGEEEISFDTTEQAKHHRWFLDRSQLHNYRLGNRLAPNRKWWEYSKVDDRSLISYYCQHSSIQISPLICEDLARQDPVAPVIRALGPNLIISLLLDGAQLKTRWPGRYASLLAEDPGSSVLTISPLGMTMRSDGTGFPPSRTVAFWCEPNGNYRELSLKENKEAIALTLEISQQQQWTADGRKSERLVLSYAGHMSI